LKNTKIKSTKQEKRIAKDIEGILQAASGSKWGYRGDILSVKRNLLVEAKTTSLKSFAFDIEDFQYLTELAIRYDVMPVLVVEFQKAAEVVVYNLYDIRDEIGQNIPTNITGQTTFSVSKELAKKIRFEQKELILRDGEDYYLVMKYDLKTRNK
jgi:hypothetical protein